MEAEAGDMVLIQKEILNKIYQIPPLSQSTVQLMRLLGEPDHNVGQVTGIVECDAALTARVLSIVNSPAFSLMQPTTSIARAVAYLGDKTILSIALLYCQSPLFHKPLEGYESEKGALWNHSLRTAIASREIARYGRESISPDIAFTGGILHDIGKALVSELLKDTSGEILSKMDAGCFMDYLAAEEKILGTNHCIVGAELARYWGLPDPLPEIIRYHHHPREANETQRSLVYAVHLGDFIAMMGGSGTGSDAMQYHLDEEYVNVIDVSSNALEKIMLQVENEFRKTKSSLFGGKGDAR